MGGSPPHFEGKNFAYWKVRMAAYLDAIAPEVWLATKTGFTGTPTTEQLKWNAKARNAIFEAISEEVFDRVLKTRVNCFIGKLKLFIFVSQLPMLLLELFVILFNLLSKCK